MTTRTVTAAEVKQKVGSHNTPPQPWSPTHCRIPVSNIDHALVDEIHDFTIERGLQAIRDVADYLFADVNRFLADRFVESDYPLDGFWRCFRAGHNLDQRNNMGRIKRVPCHAAFGMLARGLHHAHGEAG